MTEEEKVKKELQNAPVEDHLVLLSDVECRTAVPDNYKKWNIKPNNKKGLLSIYYHAGNEAYKKLRIQISDFELTTLGWLTKTPNE